MQTSSLKMFNVLWLGFCFCLIFTGFNTIGGIQTIIFNSAMKNGTDGYVEGFSGNGLVSLSIIYAVFTAANWIAPSVVALLGPRITMMAGASVYALFIAQLLILNDILLYTISGLLGVGAALIWTAQGNFLAMNSDPETMSRNSGIFWAMMISSNFFGNIFVFFIFRDVDEIDKATRNLVGIVLLCVTALGAGLLVFLRPTRWATNDRAATSSPLEALTNSAKLFVTKHMLLLSVTFFYTGLQLSIWSAVYSTCIGFNEAFGDERKALATISGIFVAIGEVLGGALFGIFGHLTVKRGRDPIVVLGFVLSMVAYFLVFINMPDDGPFGDTSTAAYIDSNKYLAIFTSFLLGFSDSCFNTQVFSILGGAFKEDSSSAFAIFKFMQSGSSAIAFAYSPVLALSWQLLIVVIFDIVGTITFCMVEWEIGTRSKVDSPVDNTCGVEEEAKEKSEGKEENS